MILRLRSVGSSHPLSRHPMATEFNIGAYFEPYVRQWLIETDNKTSQWVQAVRCSYFCHFMSTVFPADVTAARRSQRTRLVHSANYGTAWPILKSLFKFEPEGDDGFSSSIVDLFDSLRSPITFLQDLEWFDEYQQARFFTSLAKVGPMI